jgi:amino acid permease
VNQLTKLLSRQELLEGGIAGRLNKQASTLLALIENRTGRLMGESRQAASRQLSLRPDQAASQFYLAAIAQARDLTLTPTIYDLEKYAPQWAVLAPESPNVRAAVAHLLGDKYRFTHRVTPALRQALGLDTPAVQHAYQTQYGQPLSAIFASRLRSGEQVRWLWTRLASRLENLSPFWTAYSLTLTETVGAGILALPISLALLGPMAGVVALVVFGLVNLLTLAAITESITRNGNMRYGLTYFGRLVSDYLGATGAWLFGLALLGLNVMALFAYYTGIATTMASVTGLPSIVWPLLLFAITLVVLWRKSLDLTVASALLVGVINLAVIVIVSLLTLPHVRLDYLRYVDLPLLDGRAFDPGLLELVFGVVLAAYAGHTSVGNMAKSLLRRDPGGRTFLAGNAAAMLTVIMLYVLWIIAVNGAIPPATLAATTGTALIPLRAVVGRSVDLLGAVFVLLGMGMASLHFSLALFNQVREWLPTRATTTGPIRRLLLHNQVVQFVLATTPVALICLTNIWLLSVGNESFSRPLGLVGALAVPLICGIFPVLLLAASRRKGDYTPARVWRWLGNPVVLAVVYLIFLAGPALHGLILWQNPVERIAALVTCLLIVVCTLLIHRRGSFRRRRVVEIRQEEGSGDYALLAVVDNEPHPRSKTEENGHTLVQAHYARGGQPIELTDGEIPNFALLTRLQMQLPVTPARELKVWAHQVLATGDSTPLPAQVTIRQGGQTVQADLTHSGGQFITATTGERCELEICFTSSPPQARATAG